MLSLTRINFNDFIFSVDKKMTVDDFVKNLSGVDGGKDFDGKLLRSIYKAIKKQQFIGGADHVAQTQHLQQRIVQSSSASSGKTICFFIFR